MGDTIVPINTEVYINDKKVTKISDGLSQKKLIIIKHICIIVI